jgi:hypothetical protein
MSSKKEQLKKELNNFVNSGEVSDEVELIIQNALSRVEDKRFGIDEAKKYILDWLLELKNKGYTFSVYEASLYDLVKPEAKSHTLSNSIARSIISIFR